MDGPKIIPEPRPSLGEAVRFWWKLGWISFGGTAAHLSVMHDELVERRCWIDSEHFFHALSHCMLLPGPEAQQLAIYIGWKLNGKKGGVLAGVLFVLPCFLFVFLGAPWVSRSTENPSVKIMLQMITAVVVAAILQLTSFLVRGALLQDGSVGWRNINWWAVVEIIATLLLLHLSSVRPRRR
ncbi:MAG: chromate transporter [Edaphobacter sp.]